MDCHRRRNRGNERGSLIVGGVVFLVVFMMIAAMAVDLSNYYLQAAEVQNVADMAAMNGAQALNQHRNQPDVERAYEAVLRFIETHQGEQYRDLYEVYSDTQVQDIWIERHDGGLQRPYYKVGVVAHGVFEPFFMPRRVFGDPIITIHRSAVARVRSEPLRKQARVLIDCGIFADDVIEFAGQNVDASQANLCGNSDILTGGGSANKWVAKVYHYQPTTVTCPAHNGCEKIVEYPEPRPMPRFKYTDPAMYDVAVNASNYQSWPSCGTSVAQSTIRRATRLARALGATIVAFPGTPNTLLGGGGSWMGEDGRSPREWMRVNGWDWGGWTPSPYMNHKPGHPGGGGAGGGGGGAGNGKEIRTRSGAPITSDNSGDPVCISRTPGSPDRYEFSNISGQLESWNGESISIYVDGNLVFTKNKVGVRGGMYATGSIESQKNNNTFEGDPDELGGLSLWAGDTLSVNLNSTEMTGIVGAEQHLVVGGSGGGTGTAIHGIMISHGDFRFNNNSNNAVLAYDPSTFDPDALDRSDWKRPVLDVADLPLFAHTRVELVQ